MATAKVRDAAEWAARKGELSPQQLAALSWLDEQLTQEQREGFTDLWRAPGSPAAAPSPAWLAPSLAIIREFEGLRLNAYRCPANVWTIGYGLTRLENGPVREGDQITAAHAEELLVREVSTLFAPGLFALLPMASLWPANQQAALISWGYNVGLGAVEGSTLRRRLLAGEKAGVVIGEELPRWNKGAGGEVLAGLTRRRAAEAALFLGLPRLEGPAQQGTVLPELQGFPFFAQTDNGPEGWRQCQTSSIAMALAYLKVPGIHDDLDYLRVVQRHGDTTTQDAHRLALKELGVTKARFRQNMSAAEAMAELRAGFPVVAGILHHGTATAPSGGGHYVAIYGATTSAWRVNDPYGELDMVNGGWTRQGNGAGQAMLYSFKNFNGRWMPEGPKSGWAWLFS